VLQPEHSCSRRPASVAPDRLRHLRDCGTLVSGGSDAEWSWPWQPHTARAHPMHQQPTGRSAGICRRRSSRLASDSVSAGMRCAASASKRATAATRVNEAPWTSLLLGSSGGVQ